MTFVKGGVGNPLGRRAEKPFSDALRLEIAAAGDNQKVLRRIARNLLRMAQIKKGMAALPAIQALSDRLDGRPATDATVTVAKRDASDWTREELVAFLHDSAKVIEAVPNDAASAALPSRSKRLPAPS